MKRIASLLACLFALLISPVRAADVQISFDFFHDNLSPYGDWVEVGGYGYVWHPSDVDEDWAPYTDGYWSYTDAGWTWVSYEDWGGICYHYGRWVQVDDFGWCWVPDYEWGPAWVSWRKNDDYIGWAPLPPEARWDEGHGFGVWVDVNYDIGPNYYRFCRVRDFGAPVIRSVCLPWRRNVVIFGGTVNITNITYNRDYGCVFNGGFDYDYIAPRCERPLPALRLVRNTTNVFISGNRGNIFINSPRGNALVVGAPLRAERNFNVPTRAPVVKRTFAKPAISRGWAGLDKDGTRDRLLVKMRDEVRDKTPQSAPARGFRREAVSALPEKVDFTAKVPALGKVPANRKPAGKPIADADVLNKPEQPNRPAGNLPSTDANADGKPDRTPGVADRPPGTPGRQPGSNGENRRDRQPGVAGGQVDPAAPVRPAAEPQPGLRPAVEPKDQPVAGTEEPKNKPGSLLLKPVRDADGDGKPDRRRPGNQAEVPGTEVKPAIAPRPDNGNNDNESAATAAAARKEAAEQRRQNAERERAEALARQQKVIEERNRAREAGENQRRQAGENEAVQRNAEAAKRQAEAQRAQENARRNAAEAQRREATQRATEARRQQTEAVQRQRSAEAAQERAANAQRQEQAEAARQRAAEAQRQQATEANRARAEAQQRLAQARQQQQQAAAAQARAAAAENSRRQPESRPAQENPERKKKKD